MTHSFAVRRIGTGSPSRLKNRPKEIYRTGREAGNCPSAEFPGRKLVTQHPMFFIARAPSTQRPYARPLTPAQYRQIRPKRRAWPILRAGVSDPLRRRPRLTDPWTRWSRCVYGGDPKRLRAKSAMLSSGQSGRDLEQESGFAKCYGRWASSGVQGVRKIEMGRGMFSFRKGLGNRLAGGPRPIYLCDRAAPVHARTAIWNGRPVSRMSIVSGDRIRCLDGHGSEFDMERLLRRGPYRCRPASRTCASNIDGCLKAPPDATGLQPSCRLCLPLLSSRAMGFRARTCRASARRIRKIAMYPAIP